MLVHRKGDKREGSVLQAGEAPEIVPLVHSLAQYAVVWTTPYPEYPLYSGKRKLERGSHEQHKERKKMHKGKKPHSFEGKRSDAKIITCQYIQNICEENWVLQLWKLVEEQEYGMLFKARVQAPTPG